MRASTPTRQTFTACAAVCLVALTALRCARSDEPATPAGVGEVRIVSLSPAISRTLVDLGVEGRIVGRSQYCSQLDESIPVVGDLFDVDFERLVRLAPSHVLLQPATSTGVQPRLQALAEERGWTLGAWHFNSIDDVEQAIRDLPAVLYPESGPDRDALTRRAADLLNGLATAISPPAEPVFRGRTLLLADVDPPMVFGPGTYLHDLMVAFGGTNATDARDWAQLSIEDVLKIDPEAMIIVRDRGPADVDPIEAAGPLGTLDTAARRDGRIVVLHHPDAMLPSSGLIGVAESLRDTLVTLQDAGP